MEEMDFHAMKRKELQALCKKHTIPANLKNVDMANKLAELFKEKEKPQIACQIEGSDVSVSGIGSNDVIVNKKVKKVRFSPENEFFEFTGSRQTKRRGRMSLVLGRDSRLSAKDVDRGELKLGKKRGRNEKTNEQYSSNLGELEKGDVDSDGNLQEIRAVKRRSARIAEGKEIVEPQVSLGNSNRKVGTVVHSKTSTDDAQIHENDGKQCLRRSCKSLAGEDSTLDDEEGSGGKAEPDGKIEAVKVKLQRGRRKSVMPSGSGTFELKAHNNEGRNTSKSSVLQVETGGKVEPDGKTEAVKVELRRSRRKSVIPPCLGTFELEAHNEDRSTSKSSMLKVENAAGDPKDQQKVPEVVGILKGSRRTTLNLKLSTNGKLETGAALGNHETTMQFSGTCVVEQETFATQKNTRRSKRNASNKSLATIDEFGGDAIIHQKNEPVKRRRVHIPKEDIVIAHPKRTGNLNRFMTKASSNEIAAPANSLTKVGSNRKQSCTVKEPDLIGASPQEGLLAIGESFTAELYVPEVAKSTSTVALNWDSGDKSVSIEMMPRPTVELKGKMQNSCIVDVESPGMEMTNCILSSQAISGITDSQKDYVDCQNKLSDSVLEMVHLSLEGDVLELAKENIGVNVGEVAAELFSQPDHSTCRNFMHSKELQEASTVSGSADSVETSLSADALIFCDRTDFKTGSGSTDADKCVRRSSDLIHLVGAVKDVSVQKNLDTVEPLRIPETHLPIECHLKKVNLLETSNKRSDKNNEYILAKEAVDFKLSEGNIISTNSESDSELNVPLSGKLSGLEDHHVAEADETHKAERLDLADVDKGLCFEDHECASDEDGSLDDERGICDQANTSSNEDTYEPEQLKSPFVVTIGTVGSVQVREPLSYENKTQTNATPAFKNTSINREISSHAVKISNTDKDENELQLLFATPNANSSVAETFGSERISENTSFLKGSCAVKDKVDTPNNSQRKMNEERGKEYENPTNKLSGIATTYQEKSATGSGVGNEENERQQLLASQMKIELSVPDTSTIALKRNLGDKSMDIEMVSIPTVKSNGMIQDSCIVGVESPMMEMMNGIASSDVDEYAISGITDSQKDYIDCQNELSDGIVGKIHLSLEGDVHELAEENIGVTDDEIETELFSQPENSSCNNVTHGEVLEASTVSVTAGCAEISSSADNLIFCDRTDFKTGSESTEADKCVQQSADVIHIVGGFKDVLLQENLDPVEPLRIHETHLPIECHPNDVNLLETSNKRSDKNNEDISAKEEEENITSTDSESDSELNVPLSGKPRALEDDHIAEADELHKAEHLDFGDVDEGRELEDHVFASDEDGSFSLANLFDCKGTSHDSPAADCSEIKLRIDCKADDKIEAGDTCEHKGVLSELAETDECGYLKDKMVGESEEEANFAVAEESVRIIPHTIAFISPEDSDKDFNDQGTFQCSPIDSWTGFVATGFEMCQTIGKEDGVAENIKEKEVETSHDMPGNEIFIDTTIGDNELGISYQANKSSIEDTNEPEKPKSPFVVTIDGARSVQVKETFSYEKKTDTNAASTFKNSRRKREITSDAVEISNTDEDKNELQLLFATPIKIDANYTVDETFDSERISESTSFPNGSSTMKDKVDTPNNSQRKMNEERGKHYEKPINKPLFIVTDQEKSATGSSVWNEGVGNSVLPSGEVICNEDVNLAKVAEVMNLNTSEVLPVAKYDAYETSVEKWTEKTCEQLKGTGSLSEENIFSLGKTFLEEETDDDHEPGEKKINEASSLGLLEGNRFYLLSDEVALDLFEPDTPKDNVPENNHHVFVEPTSPEVAKGNFSSLLSNASHEHEEVQEKKDIEFETNAENRDGVNVWFELQTSSEIKMVTMDADMLTSNSRHWSLVEEKAVTLQNVDDTVPATETGSTALCALAESDLFSNLEMQLLAGENNNNDIELAEGESSNSGAPTSGKADVLKESDVMETIQEYIDSESSLSVDFDDAAADLHFEKSTHVEERKNSKSEDQEMLFMEIARESETVVQFPASADLVVDEGCEANVMMVPEKGMDSECRQSSVLEQKQFSTAKNARTILIHGTPSKALAMADMKENVPQNKVSQAGHLTTLRPAKRRALRNVQFN